ncbi:unnamed protein product, partial [Tetraodon nigroviridis]
VVLQEESVSVGGEFATPQEDSSATPSESLIDKLHDHMMESVIISDSPNNSEEDDVAPIDNFFDAGEEGKSTDPAGEEEKQFVLQNAIDFKISAEESEEKVEEDAPRPAEVPVADPASPDAERPTSSDVRSAPQAKNTSPKGEPVPVCTIFSQGAQPRSLMPDGFQPTLIKSPSLSMGSGGGSMEAATSGKTTTPLVCQPSPSLSKFFTDNGQANPGSDFFDSFTAPSSFISVSNPNAELPPGPGATPGVFATEHQLSSTPSSVRPPEGSICGSTTTTTTTTTSSSPQHTLAPALQPPPDPSTTAPQPQPFNHLQAVFLASDDPFAKALNLSEVDRRHDAWLPSEETKKVLIEVATQRCNPALVDTSMLTMPGLKFDNLQGDAVKDLMLRFLGEQTAMKRQVLTANAVEQSFTGLKQLISSKNWRAAVDLTGRLLTVHGQGYGKAGQPTSHTTESLQVCVISIVLLCCLLFCFCKFQERTNLPVREASWSFNNNNSLSQEYVTVTYMYAITQLRVTCPSRGHSLFPVTHTCTCTHPATETDTDLMQDCGKSQPAHTNFETTQTSLKLWRSRLSRVMYSMANCLLLMKDYVLAVETYHSIIQYEPQQKVQLLSGIGRIFLQIGDIKTAERYFLDVEEACQNKGSEPSDNTCVLMNRAFVYLCQNNYVEAHASFIEVLKIDPKNPVANNNAAVCLLYLGRLKESLGQLEGLVQQDPSLYLHESVLFNLTTMYELESSRSTQKKQALLEAVACREGDSFNTQCLKLV